MAFLNAVRGTLAVKVVPLHHAGRTAALAGAGHVDGFDVSEQADVERLADLELSLGIAELANDSLGFHAGTVGQLHSTGTEAPGALAIEFGNVTTFAAAGQSSRLIREAHLHGLVPIALRGTELEYVARTCLDNRDGNHVPDFVKYLRHPDLAAE